MRVAHPFLGAQGRAVKARVREVLFALAAGPPRACSARLGRGEKSGCAGHRHDVHLKEQVVGCPPKGLPRGVPGHARGTLLPPGHSRQPGGKARPARCPCHHRDGASGSAKGSIRNAQLGHALCIYTANKITIIKIKKIQRQGCGFHPLGSTTDGAGSGAASTRGGSRGAGPSRDPRAWRGPSLPAGQRPSSASRRGFPRHPDLLWFGSGRGLGAGGAQ